MADKRKILVVGGISKNIPKWINDAFEVDHYESETHFKRQFVSKADVIVILQGFVSHKQSSDAKKYAKENDIPLIVADKGWASALAQAADRGMLWLIDDIGKEVKDAPLEDKLDVMLNDAWRLAYKREYEKSRALERRLRKDRERLEESLAKLNASESRENTAARVITEVREAARKHREDSEQTRSEIRRVANELREKIDKLLSEHEVAAQKHVSEISELRKKLSRLSEI